MIRRLSAKLSLGPLLLACACASSPRSQPAAEPEAPRGQRLAEAEFGDLVEQWITAPGNLYVRRPRPDLSGYHALRFESAAVYYDQRVTPPVEGDHRLLVRALNEFLLPEVATATGLPASQERGAGVLRVRSEVNDLDFDRNRATGSSRVTSIIQSGGAALFVLELADDASGAPLVRVALRRTMPGGVFTGPWSPDIDRARQLFRELSEDAHQSLALVFGRESASR